MTNYKFQAKDADKFTKYGVDLTVYGGGIDNANLVHVVCEEGHFEEFMDMESHYMYYVIEGSGVFMLNDEQIPAEATDLIVIPPNTRTFYFGTMKMLLVVSPAFSEETRMHIRDVPKTENPLHNTPAS